MSFVLQIEKLTFRNPSTKMVTDLYELMKQLIEDRRSPQAHLAEAPSDDSDDSSTAAFVDAKPMMVEQVGRRPSPAP